MQDGWGQVRGRGTNPSQKSREWGGENGQRREFQPELEGPDISQLEREGKVREPPHPHPQGSLPAGTV